MAAEIRLCFYIILVNNANFNPWLILQIQKSKMLDCNAVNITILKNSSVQDTRFTQQSIPLFYPFDFVGEAKYA